MISEGPQPKWARFEGLRQVLIACLSPGDPASAHRDSTHLRLALEARARDCYGDLTMTRSHSPMWPLALLAVPACDPLVKRPTLPETDVADIIDVAPSESPSDAGAEVELTDVTDEISDTDEPSEDTEPPFICPWEDWSGGLSGGRVARIEFDPRVPGLAWSVSGGSLFRSIDDGLSWALVASELPGHLLAYPPDDVKSLIVGGDGLSISRDGGESFEPLALDGLETTALMLDPAIADRLWVGTNALGILRSDNEGETFAARNNGVGLVRVLSFAGFADVPDLILAGTVGLNDNLGVNDRGAILRTEDGGRAWTTVLEDARWTTDLEVCKSDPTRVFAAVRKGVRESRDRGLTWSSIPGLDALDVLEVKTDPSCETLWLSVYQKGIYRVTDTGRTVSGPMSQGLDLQHDHLAGQLGLHPLLDGVLLLGTHAGAFRTGNGGLRWQRVPAARGLLVTRLLEGPDRTYLASWGGGLWARTDAGWDRVASFTQDYLYSLSRLEGETLLIGGAASTWLGQDGDWRKLSGPVNVFDARALPDGSLLAAAQVTGLSRSSDGGVTWTPSNGGLTPWSTAAGTFIDTRTLIDLGDSRLLAGTRGRGVIRSDDLGLTWSLVDNILAQDAVLRLVSLETFVIALVEGKGLYRSLDRGETWSPLDLGPGTPDLRDLIHDHETGWLFAAQGRGPLIVSRDAGNTWETFSSYCGDAFDFSALTFSGRGPERRLVGALSGNRILAHRLGSPR